MKGPNEFDLLSDVAKLLRKHGPEAFERLGELLASPVFAVQLARILSEGARVGRHAKVEPDNHSVRGRSGTELRLSLVELAAAEPERSRMLVSLYDELASKALLPRMRDLRTFALNAGLSPIKSNARAKAVEELIESLQPLPFGELQRIVARIERTTDDRERSLENWTRIIFDQELRTKKAE